MLEVGREVVRIVPMKKSRPKAGSARTLRRSSQVAENRKEERKAGSEERLHRGET